MITGRMNVPIHQTNAVVPEIAIDFPNVQMIVTVLLAAAVHLTVVARTVVIGDTRMIVGALVIARQVVTVADSIGIVRTLVIAHSLEITIKPYPSAL